MADSVITKRLDVLSHLCFDHYGSVANGEVEATLEANPGLEDQPILLAEGLVIVFPYIPPTSIKVKKQIKLWN